MMIFPKPNFRLLTGWLFILLSGCTFPGPETDVELVIPTRVGSVASTAQTVASGNPPVITTADSGLQQVVRPTWTPLPTQTLGPQCQQPTRWTSYTVERGNTLSAIARWSGSTVAELTQVNCIVDPTRIEIGQRLYVPQKISPTATPTASATPIPTETVVPTVIDFFKIEPEVTSADGEVTLHWQIRGAGRYRLTWMPTLSEIGEPILLAEGEQGEFLLDVTLPESGGAITFTLSVTDADGRRTEQMIHVGP